MCRWHAQEQIYLHHVAVDTWQSRPLPARLDPLFLEWPFQLPLWFWFLALTNRLL